MDASSIVACLFHTLTPNAQDRKNAEAQLKQMETMKGYPIALLQILSHAEVDVAVKQAASIYLKRLAMQSWAPPAYPDPDQPPPYIINDEDKAAVRENLLAALIHSAPLIRVQVGLVMKQICEYDFPQNWPNLLPNVMQCLVSKDVGAMYGGLLALRLIIRKYEYMAPGKKKRQPLQDVVKSTFPVLIQLFQGLLAMSPRTLVAAEMLLLLCKIFWSSIYFDIPEHFHVQDNFFPWMNQLLVLIQMEVPSEGQPEDLTERESWPWWKCKKWAAQIFFRLFQRYGDVKCVEETEKEFSKHFRQIYSPKLLECFLSLLFQKGSGAFLPGRVANEALSFLDVAIMRNETYKGMKPHSDQLFQQVIFPTMCFNNQDAELWAEDPHEYLRKEFDVIEEFYSPRTSATNLCCDYITKRTKNHLPSFMSFIISVLKKYEASPPQERNAQHKDGALQVISAWKDKLKNLPDYANQLETMLVQHVLPELKSAHGFLRARACHTFAQFYDVDYSNPENFKNGLRGVLSLLEDGELPVRVMSALALRHLMQRDDAREVLEPILPTILQQLFKLMGEIDFDELVNTLELVIETFADQMGPYCVTICSQLSGSFVRMADNDEEDSIIAAMECLGAIQTVLDSISTLPHLFPQVEEVLFPLLVKLLQPQSSEYFEEALKILSFLTYFSPTISEKLWSLFPRLCECFHQWGIDFISDLLIPFDNYISRSTEMFLAGNFQPAIFGIYEMALSEEHASDEHSIDGCKLGESVLMNCKGKVDDFVPQYIEVAVKRLAKARKSQLKAYLLSIVANAIYYNPHLTMRILEEKGWTTDVFTMWFQMVPKLDGMHLKKLSVLALTSVLSVPITSLPVSIRSGLNQILEVIISLQVRLEKQRQAIAEEKGKPEEEEDDDDIESDGELAEDDEPKEDLAFLAAEAAKYYTDAKSDEDEESGEDEDLVDSEDEGDFSSAIDVVDEIQFFVHHMHTLSQSDSATYGALMNQINPEARATFNQMVQRAQQAQQQQ